MQGFFIWGAFTIAVAAFCVWRPQPARIFVGLFFGSMGLGIHGGLIATNPQSCQRRSKIDPSSPVEY